MATPPGKVDIARGRIIGRSERGASLRVFVGALVVVAVGSAAAGQTEQVASFYAHKEAGWFWYEDPPPLEEEAEEPVSPPAAGAAPSASPTPMSVEWLRVNLPLLRDRAIDQPTNENVSAYFYAQRIMMDKAQVFSDVAREVSTSDPLLDENLRVPIASAAKAAMLKGTNSSKEAILRAVAEKAGLWIFHDDTCEYCTKQVPSANALARRYGLRVVYLSRQGGPIRGLDPSIPVKPAGTRFERLGVNYTPSVMLVVPPDGYYLISQGFASLTALEDRLVNAAHRYGLIDERLYYDAVPTARGVLSADATQNVGTVDWNSPEQWVPHLRKVLAETYGLGESK